MAHAQPPPPCIVVSAFGGEAGWVVSGENRPDRYHSELARSRLCLAPSGWELWSVRFYEALLLGCVPVIMSDGLQLPFEALVDYSKVAVRYVSHLSLTYTYTTYWTPRAVCDPG